MNADIFDHWLLPVYDSATYSASREGRITSLDYRQKWGIGRKKFAYQFPKDKRVVYTKFFTVILLS
jgi:hypothetical protein